MSCGKRVYDDVHVIDRREVGSHTTGKGPGGCFCEPTVHDVVYVGRLVRRTIVHNVLSDTAWFYKEYEEQRDADRRRN